MKPEGQKAKPQPTLHGYTAWIVNRLVKAKGIGEGPAAAWIIDRWVDENGEFLEKEFGLTRRAFEEARVGGRLVQHPSSAQRTK